MQAHNDSRGAEASSRLAYLWNFAWNNDAKPVRKLCKIRSGWDLCTNILKGRLKVFQTAFCVKPIILLQELDFLCNISPPTPLNFSTNVLIFSKTLCFLVKYCGLSGLIFGKTAFKSAPFSLTYSRFNETVI
ncbi:hypothetical protein AABM17_2175 [Neisseria musculi]|uniref:Uncharacterized protein n=1 Tax=Neisseria musculi TaxID=1815583 RepID=A0A7H1MD89_9NEIS|nr:hypothetical protein H7A79_2174 [Neisseria musculi]